VSRERIPKNAYLTTMGMFGDLAMHDLTIEAGAAGATVEVFLVSDGALVGRQVTDGEGRSVLWQVPALEYRIVATAGGGAAETSIVLDQDRTVTLSP